jgi:hypothetical protein
MLPRPILTAPLRATSGTTGSTLFGESIRPGCGIAVCVGSNSATPTSLRDAAGNKYTLAVSGSFFGAQVTSIWYCEKAVGAPLKIEALFGSSQTTIIMGAVQFDRPVALGGTASSNGNTTTPNTGTATIRTGQEAAIAFYFGGNLNSTATGFVTIGQSSQLAFAYALPALKRASWTSSTNSPYSACIATVRAAPISPRRATSGPFPFSLFLGDGLNHASVDLTGMTAQGFGFGATFFDPEPIGNATQGIGFGAGGGGLPELPGTTSQGLGLGAAAGNVEALDGATAGFGLGATDSALADDLATSIVGFALGASAGNPDSFDNSTQGLGLGSNPADVFEGVGFTTQGMGLGAVGSLGFLSDSTTEGLSFGVMASDVIQNEASATAGVGLGAATFLVDQFVRVAFGMAFGSSPDEDVNVTEGIGLGAIFRLDDQFTDTATGLGFGARFTSDSGDLSNGRYRR